MKKHNLLIVHGGAPTAVINASLYGVLKESALHPEIDKVYGAIDGTDGILQKRFVCLSDKTEAEIDRLLYTPASAIGSSRLPLTDEDYVNMARIIREADIKYVLFNGGNGSMDTCGKLQAQCGKFGIGVVGIPKTVDNDISITDHAPGFGSAARFAAESVYAIAQDVRALPIHVCIVETMGRNAGWITASTALARSKPEDAPHLIYLSEVAFDEDKFVRDVKACYERNSGVVVAVSEGLRRADGTSIVAPIYKSGRAVYFGDVSAYLAQLVIQKLGIKARSEKPGILGRSSAVTQSEVDRDEAIAAGREAAQAVIGGETGIMIGFERLSSDPYQIRLIHIPIEQVMLHERTMPSSFIAPEGNDVTDRFIEWCKPLVGTMKKDFITFKE